MRNHNLETTLRNWFEEMVNRYKWLNIKFEYSEKREIYLVSYSPVQKIEEDESFMRDSMDFEDKISILYGDEAPLFCDEEKYFRLSSDAETIKCKSFESFNINIARARITQPSNFAPKSYKILECSSFSNNYALAA